MLEEVYNSQRVLVSPPILVFPDYQRPFLLDTDASSVIGAVLSQVQDDGKERVIAYGSRVLSKAERALLWWQNS